LFFVVSIAFLHTAAFIAIYKRESSVHSLCAFVLCISFVYIRALYALKL